ncbi:glycosyl transferase [Novosphingobium malaysiense]|uniref:Glycosyl transferase n=2 Tax=Novosphingobium malaysiense TaxID=1348853 RepID=A0A0B1ZUL4_9SPHN|nr:glycosyl transferase [Novosphingobium malaysiense]
MPLHNKAEHVAAAIESALAQDFAPFEIVVVDDRSTDGSRDIAASFAGERLRLLGREEPGPGGYAARNLGIREARGDWIAFLDADDLWREDHLAVLARAIANAPGAGAAATRFDHVFDTHRQPQRIAQKLEAGAVLDFRQFLECWLEVRECPMWTGAIALRRDVLIDAGLFPEGRARRGGDKDLWLRAMRRTSLAYDPTFTADFSRDSSNKVSKTTNTLSTPCLIGTARKLMTDADTEERRLLRRLINQEIAHYARYSLKLDQPIRIPLSDVNLPEGLGTLAMLAVTRWTPVSWRKSAYHFVKSLRAGSARMRQGQ